ncbi:MAG: DUF167 domain-containing protein [Chloroflexota bacterium]
MADLPIRLQPRAGRDEVVGQRAGRVVIRVAAPPVDGRANAALCAFVAGMVGVPKGRVRVVSGEASRDKVLRVEGMSPAELRAALGLERS